eukprot:5932848-Alexandrium_andersonii.AAC.1
MCESARGRCTRKGRASPRCSLEAKQTCQAQSAQQAQRAHACSPCTTPHCTRSTGDNGRGDFVCAGNAKRQRVHRTTCDLIVRQRACK